MRAMFITGAMSGQAHDEVFAEFTNDPSIWVLVATNIFSTRINITQACILIHFVSFICLKTLI